MQKSRAETFIGFCIRARKLTCGSNAIEQQRNHVFLLLLCHSASENAKQNAVKLSKKFHCNVLLVTGKTLEEITGKQNCKLAAVRDQNLARAIESATDENITIYAGGNG